MAIEDRIPDWTRVYSGAAEFGVTPDNAVRKLANLAAYTGGDKGTDKFKARVEKFLAGKPNNATWNAVRTAMRTGDFSMVQPETALLALDHGYRETARHSKRSKEAGFFEKLAEFAAPIAAGAINPWLGAAVGAGVGGRRGGVPGALVGGLGGYLSGSAIDQAGGVGGILTKARDAVGGFVSDPWGTLTGAAQAAAPSVGTNAVDRMLAGASGAAGGGAGAAGAGGGGIVGRLVDAAPWVLAAGGAGALGGGSDYSAADDAAARALEERALQERATRTVDSAFRGLDDNYYKRLRGDIYNYQTGRLGEEFEDRGVDLKHELARRGHLMGSPEVDATSELRRLYNEGRLEAGRLADETVLGARRADAAARANAQRDIIGGVGAGQAVSSAIDQSTLQAQQLADAAKGQDLSDIFYGSAYLYNQNRNARDLARAGAAYRAYRGGPGPASTATGQTQKV